MHVSDTEHVSESAFEGKTNKACQTEKKVMMQFALWKEGELQGDSGFASIVMHHSDRTSSLTNVSAMFENENSYFLTE
jgi:hypothetical protein